MTEESPTDDVTRSLPHAVGPEKSVLSSILQDPQEYIPLGIELGLSPDHFYAPGARQICQTIFERFAAGFEIELVSLVQYLLDNGLLDRCGGPGNIGELYTYAPTPGHFRHHCKLVRDKFVLRSLIQFSNETIAEAYDAPGEADELLEATERRVLAIREGMAEDATQSTQGAVLAVLGHIEAALKREPKARGILTGFEEMDRKTNGMHAGDMIVIGARPSMGKTSFGVNVAEFVCMDSGLPVGIFSAEMSREAIVQRLILSRSRFAMGQMSRGYTPNKGDLRRIQRAAKEVHDAKLFIDDSSGPTIDFIRAKARRWRREHGIAFLLIDYLQLIKSKSKQAQSSREREIAEISAGVKGLAKDLGIPIMILAQLNRGPESRGGGKSKPGKPRMSDLRESGAVEQDADVVGLLYRDAYYAESDDEKESSAGRSELCIAKNRNGETGSVPLTFIADLMRFETGAPHEEEPVHKKSRFDL